LFFLGSIKWLENAVFTSHDLATLQKHRAAITYEPVPLVAVSRGGVGCSGLQAVYRPEELNLRPAVLVVRRSSVGRGSGTSAPGLTGPCS
jgi:hypothetical protein